MYDQKKLWLAKWQDGKAKAVNNFAKRSFCEIKKYPRVTTLLDLGCGAGQDAVYFASKGLQVTALDFSETSIQRVPKNIKNLQVACLDISTLCPKPNSFDIIYAHLSLHYFDDNTTTQIFERLYYALKQGGLIFIKCKSTDDALYGLGEKIEADMFCMDNHVRHFFSKAYMKEKLSMFDLIISEKLLQSIGSTNHPILKLLLPKNKGYYSSFLLHRVSFSKIWIGKTSKFSRIFQKICYPEYVWKI